MTSIKQFSAMFEALTGKSIDDVVEKSLKGDGVFGSVMKDKEEKPKDFLGNEIDEES